MKLKTIRLKNLLCHVDSKVDVADHLTVFTGLSDSGKSGVMRGLNQTLRNLPAGIDLLRHGAPRGSCSETELEIEVEDKARKIVRRRGKTFNNYELDGQPLMAIGREVPEEVASLFNLSAHAFQLQSDGNFLLSETDGNVAKALSSTVGLAQIDAAFTEIRTRKTANDTALRVAQADADREAEEANKYAALSLADSLVNEAEGARAGLEKAKEDAAGVEDRILQLEALPEDAVNAVSLARIALVDADNLRIALEEETAVLQSVDLVVDGIERIVPDIGGELEDARVSLLLASEATGVFATRDTDANGAEILLGQIDGISLGAGMAPMRAALLTTKAKEAAEASVAAACEIGDMSSLLERLYSLKPDEAKSIEVADALCFEASNRWERARDGTIEADEAADFERELTRVVQQGAVCQGAQVFEEQAIEQFKSAHPVCPECGAEQRHWHIR